MRHSETRNTHHSGRCEPVDARSEGRRPCQAPAGKAPISQRKDRPHERVAQCTECCNNGGKRGGRIRGVIRRLRATAPRRCVLATAPYSCSCIASGVSPAVGMSLVTASWRHRCELLIADRLKGGDGDMRISMVEKIQRLNLLALIAAAVGVGFITTANAQGGTYRGCYTEKACDGGSGLCGWDPSPAPN